MTPTWITISKASVGRGRGGFKEPRTVTYLLSDPDAAHVLAGEHGRRVLAAAAEAWNRSGYQTSQITTRCRADYSTEAARKTFTLSITR